MAETRQFVKSKESHAEKNVQNKSSLTDVADLDTQNTASITARITPVEKSTTSRAASDSASIESPSNEPGTTNQLTQRLEKVLTTLPSGLQLKVYNVRTQPRPFQLYPEKQTTVQHHLLLVTGQKEDNEQLVCGIESDEFITDGEKVLYIGKLDSTGAYRGVISKVIQAYVKSESPCRVHVFARSQPQYLFHRSGSNKDKPVLSDRNLIRWWYKVLSLGQGWWSIPGIDDEVSARHELGQRKQDDWKYGYPYDDDAEASKVVPRFSDDAKSRLLNKGENMSVKDFWTMLGITEECGHHLTGFFVVDVGGQTYEAKERRGIEGDEYTLFWNYFMELSFEDSDSVTDSTRKLVSKWKEMGFDNPAMFITRGPAYSLVADTPKQANVLSTFRKPPENVNTLSTTSIRRRPETVNTLSATAIRRKRPRADDQ